MALTFDERGYLKPYNLIETDWDTFVEKFILSFDNSFSRNLIFSEFGEFVQTFKSLLGQQAEVWINGSFTTLKENPNDIDLVIFISHNQINRDLKAFILKNQRNCQSKIDAYLVEIFDENHRNYVFYETDRKYWFSQFSTTAPNRRKERFSKGIIKMTI